MILSDSTPSDSVCDGDQAVRSQQKTTLFQLELDYRNINCGMSYVIQMRNGEFFLIDGGYFTDGEEERLYRFLSARAPDGDIRIAGWFSLMRIRIISGTSSISSPGTARA